VPVAAHEDRVVPALKEMPVETVALVEVVRVAAVEAVHADREISVHRLDNEVVVVRHQAVGETSPGRPVRDTFDKA
jgi:hypothetical protein